MAHAISEYWPFGEFRRYQLPAIEAIAKAFAAGKDFVAVEAPTGSGKSPIAIAAARWILENPECTDIGERASKIKSNPGAYCLTTQKVLQRQYMRDFAEHETHPLVDMCGRGNFQCKFDDNGRTCENGICHKWADQGQVVILKDGETTPPDATERTRSDGQRFYIRKFNKSANCVYRIAKLRIVDEPLVIHNFAYFMTETNYVGEFKPRDLLIIDEAHNIEKELLGFIEVPLGEFVLRKIGVEIPKKFKNNNPCVEDVYEWAKSILKDHIKPHYKDLVYKLGVLNKKLKTDPWDEQATVELDRLKRDAKTVESLIHKMDTLFRSVGPDNCVLESKVTSKGKEKYYRLVFKPIDIAPFAERCLFRNGRKVLMLSATILDPDTFADSLGIDRSKMQFIRIPSTFEPENRRIVYRPIGSMARRSIDETLPKMVKAVCDILDAHPEERGLIHTNTYRIAGHLMNNIRGHNATRLMIHGTKDREQVLMDFLSDPTDNRVLVSPSMTDGVSLDDDLARFQIVCKVPYGYLGDPQVAAKMNISSAWYELQTAKALMQAFGRAVRSIDDHAVTYILDEDFGRFYKKARKRLFPPYIQDAIVEEAIAHE